MPKKRDHLRVVGADDAPKKKSTRSAKRSYEDEIPSSIDLEAEPDYSVLLAEADKARAEAAIVIQKYRVMKETEERVRRVNEIFRRTLCGTDAQ